MDPAGGENMKTIVCAICLLPIKANQKYLDPIIASLTKTYGAYPFFPHLTVYGVLRGPREEIEEQTNHAIKDVGKFSLQVDKLDHSPVFSKTLFIQFKMNDSILKIYKKLSQRLQKYLINCEEYHLNPHMSLIYKHNIQDEEKEKIIKSLNIKHEFTFGSCTIVTAAKPIEKEEDVKGWAIAYERKFL